MTAEKWVPVEEVIGCGKGSHERVLMFEQGLYAVCVPIVWGSSLFAPLVCRYRPRPYCVVQRHISPCSGQARRPWCVPRHQAPRRLVLCGAGADSKQPLNPRVRVPSALRARARRGAARYPCRGDWAPGRVRGDPSARDYSQPQCACFCLHLHLGVHETEPVWHRSHRDGRHGLSVASQGPGPRLLVHTWARACFVQRQRYGFLHDQSLSGPLRDSSQSPSSPRNSDRVSPATFIGE